MNDTGSGANKMGNTIKGTDLTLSELLRIASDAVRVFDAQENHEANMGFYWIVDSALDMCFACLGGAAAETLENSDGIDAYSWHVRRGELPLLNCSISGAGDIEIILDNFRAGCIAEAFRLSGIPKPAAIPDGLSVSSEVAYYKDKELAHWYWETLADMLEECGY